MCFGVIGLPHTAVRCISYKDSKAVHRGIIIGTIVVAILMLGMHLAGALGRAVIPISTRTGSGDPDVNGKSAATVCCRDLLARNHALRSCRQLTPNKVPLRSLKILSEYPSGSNAKRDASGRCRR